MPPSTLLTREWGLQCAHTLLLGDTDEELELGSSVGQSSVPPPPPQTKSCFSEMCLIRLFFLLRSLNGCKAEIGPFYSANI